MKPDDLECKGRVELPDQKKHVSSKAISLTGSFHEIPLFSVIIPVYNMEDYLERCVQSVLIQDFDDYELLLVDDGSSDGSSDLCDRYADSNPKVRVIHKSNGGLVSARNVGVREARGEYVIWIDADDWIESGTLALLYEKAVRPYEPDAVIYGAQHVFEDGSKTVLPCYASPGFYDRDQMEEAILPNMIYYDEEPFCRGLFNPMACNKMYRTDILRQSYCRDERIRMAEDAAFVFEALYLSDSLVIVEEVLYDYYKGNESSITSTYDANRFYNNRILNDYITGRLAGKEPWLDRQINALRAYLLFMAIFHEARYGTSFVKSCRNMSKSIRDTNALGDIDRSSLPKSARMFLGLISTGMHPLILLSAKIGAKLKD